MYTILRKDLICLFLRNSSHLCKSRVPFSTCISENKSAINPEVFDFLVHKHHFSPEAAAKAASAFTCLRNPEKSDSLLSFLKENGFSNSHLEKIFKYKPSFISADLEKSVKPKIKIFQELGFSNNDIASLFAKNASILSRSANNQIFPALSLLRNLMGSDANVVKLVMKSGWFLIMDLDKYMVPNIEFFKSRNVPMEQIMTCIRSYSRFMLQNPETVRKYAEKAEELGAKSSSKMYIHAVRVIGSMSDETWKSKLQALRGLGFSEDEILNTYIKNAPVFAVSAKKMKEVYEILVSTGKYDVASIVSYPVSLCGSVEKRYKPRLQVLAALDHKKLIKKWPSITTLCSVTDKYFFERYVGPYIDEVGHLFDVKSTTRGKSKAMPQFLCKSKVPLSTSTEKKSAINPTVFDFLIHKHHFSPEAAAETASALTCLRNPEKSDSLLSFLKENGFSNSHLEKIFKYKPSFISVDLEKSVKSKIKIFQELGFSNNDIVSLFSSDASILYRSTNNRVIPALSMLRNLLGSDANVVKLVMKCGWFLIKDLDKNMVPNIEFLKSRNVPMEQIISCMHSFPRFLLQNPENMRKNAEKAEELGARSSSKMYIYAVRVAGSLSNEAWESKVQALRGLGFSEDEILNVFRTNPPVFTVSVKKMKEIHEILVSTGKYDATSIVSYPTSLYCSIEKRYKPRLQVLVALDRKKLIKKWPSLARLCSVSDKYFFERYVRPHIDEVGHLFGVKSTTK